MLNSQPVFISYAQNLEDVMLWRALQHVEKGFYIDIGACHPTFDSVTSAFYDAGWNGINVEPNPKCHQDFVAGRPRDTNLNCAVGSHNGSIKLHVSDNRGLSTAVESFARKHEQEGWTSREQVVPIQTLTKIASEFVPHHQSVQFLKIDVEGLEKDVLQGNDWTRLRPWILVIEATEPCSQIEVHADWEPLVKDNRYSFVYADGLNRFYVAAEYKELATHFRYPPNVFDNYKLRAQVSAEARAEKAESVASNARARAARAEAELKRSFSLRDGSNAAK